MGRCRPTSTNLPRSSACSSKPSPITSSTFATMASRGALDRRRAVPGLRGRRNSVHLDSFQLHLFLVFHSPILKPDLDLPLCEIEHVGHLNPARAAKIPVEVKLFFQLNQLGARVSCSCSLGRAFLAVGEVGVLLSIWFVRRTRRLLKRGRLACGETLASAGLRLPHPRIYSRLLNMACFTAVKVARVTRLLRISAVPAVSRGCVISISGGPCRVARIHIRIGLRGVVLASGSASCC